MLRNRAALTRHDALAKARSALALHRPSGKTHAAARYRLHANAKTRITPSGVFQKKSSLKLVLKNLTLELDSDIYKYVRKKTRY